MRAFTGNLTLTGYNGELSNAPFATKRLGFASSNVSLNAALAAEPTWDGAAIRRRGARLAECILLRWPALNPESAADGSGVAAGRAPSVRPKAVRWQGQRLPVRTWVEVAVVTLRALAAAQPELLAALALRRPTYLSQQPDLLRSAAPVLPPWHYEGHNNADGHRRFCRFALEQAGFADADWLVETVE